MSRLRAKFEAELPPGAVVLTHTFAVPGWVPETSIRAPDLYRTLVYRIGFLPISVIKLSGWRRPGGHADLRWSNRIAEIKSGSEIVPGWK